jgi:hypothetical protein
MPAGPSLADKNAPGWPRRVAARLMLPEPIGCQLQISPRSDRATALIPDRGLGASTGPDGAIVALHWRDLDPEFPDDAKRRFSWVPLRRSRMYPCSFRPEPNAERDAVATQDNVNVFGVAVLGGSGIRVVFPRPS